MLTVFVFEDKNIYKRQIKNIKTRLKGISAPLDAGIFSGKEQERLMLYPLNSASKRILLLGLGKAEKLSLEQLRRASAWAAKAGTDQKATTIALLEPDPDIIAKTTSDFGDSVWGNIGIALAEGAALGLYAYDKYFSRELKKGNTVKQVTFISENKSRAKQIAKGVHIAQVICEGTYLARDLENAPGNEIYPDSLAGRARESGRKYKFNVTVFDEKKIRKLRMGGLLGVAQGSAKPPRFIVMEHKGKNSRLGTVVLVGKGVTFDSGGISIKPSANMAEMKMDMSGAAAVIGTMQAAARLKLPVRIVGLVPATENLLGGAAMKPGDILTHYNGKTSEVDNTDAEGRLILADALSYASRYRPDVVIDLATLTGACVVALGNYATGMMGNNDEMMHRLKLSGERTYERVWQLPMFDEYEKLIKSDVADVKNVGPRWGGAITAAMFLKKFIGNYKWVHLDIAGTAILEEAQDYAPKGGSGVGVRLLIDFLRYWSKD